MKINRHDVLFAAVAVVIGVGFALMLLGAFQ